MSTPYPGFRAPTPPIVLPLLLAVLALAIPLVRADAGLTRRDADAFDQKLQLIQQYAERPARTPRSTTIAEREVNAYFRYHGKEQVPVGIVDPYIMILGEGRLGGRATVDLDAVRTQKTRGWLDPLAYLAGSLPVTATGRLLTNGGTGRFELEAAEIAGVSVPKGVLQELLSYYSRTPEHPRGIDMDESFELPAAIREIQVGKGQAVILQ
jgi:hypothetical protein